MEIKWFAIIFGALLMGAALFIWTTSGSLPEIVATHFSGAGTADGFRDRGNYLVFMLSITTATSAFPLLLLPFMIKSKPKYWNLPHRDYWLAPERRPETNAFFIKHMLVLGSMFSVFFCGMHYLTIRANRLDPPRLPSLVFAIGLVAFVAAPCSGLASFSGGFENPRSRLPKFFGQFLKRER